MNDRELKFIKLINKNYSEGKISEYDYNRLNDKNKVIYNIIIQIIDEFHSTIHKSENSYSCFIKYLNIFRLINL